MNFIEIDPATAFGIAIDSLGEATKTVVCGSEEDKQYIEESMNASTKSVEAILDSAEKIDIKAWFNSRRKELEENLGKDLNDSLGEWPKEPEGKQGFTLSFDMLSGELHEKLVGASITVDESWKVPAYFKFGDWNECPNVELHCAIWKYWQEKYGAHLVGVSNDILEAYVTNPPETPEEAMELAWEQYVYCRDIVDEGLGSVSNLGSSIENHHAWFFWWD